MQLYEDRRALHRIPEVSLCLPKTARYVTESLKQLSCRVFSPIESAVCAFFDFGAAETIAFRSDMDALPGEEKSGLPFASTHPGRMHACGHDGHMAMLLELARRLEKMTLRVNVLLIFQPGEEGPGGAKPICDTGLLEEYHVSAIFGLHLWPGLEKGCLYSRKGSMMSRSCEVDLTVCGKAAHVGKSWEGLDALAACAAFYTRAVAMERAMDPAIFRLLKFGHMEAGTVRNIIAESARLEGTLRTFDDGVFEQMHQNMQQIAVQVQEETGCALRLHLSEGYPAVYNDEKLYEKIEKILPVRELAQPNLITEDFSWYQRRVAGVFFFLGLGETPALHATNFDFDEAVLEQGVALLEKIAVNYK